MSRPPFAVTSCDVAVAICQDRYKAVILKHILSKEHLGSIHKAKRFLYVTYLVMVPGYTPNCNQHCLQSPGRPIISVYL